MTSTMLPPRPAEPPVRDRLRRVVQAIALVSARRPKTMIALWLAIVAGCLVAGGMAGTTQLTGTQSGVGESRHADERLAAAGLRSRAGETFLVRARDAARAGDAAAALTRRLDANPRVAAVHDGTTAAGGRAVLVQATLRGDPDDAGDRAPALDRAATAARGAVPGATIVHAGDASFSHTFDDILGEDLKRAETISLPIALIILAIAFGALVAACVPLVLGVTAVAGAIGATSLVSHIAPVADSTTTVVTLIGLAVGIDYSLFYIRREREERRKGRDAHAALEASAATVGRAIVVSGLTVMVAVAGLLVTGMEVFASMALGTMVVVVLAVIGSVTVLPAMLALLGDRINWPRPPRLHRRRVASRRPGRSVWHGIAGAVTRRPVVALVLACCLLGALAVPAMQMRTASTGVSDLPRDNAVVRAQHDIERTFGATTAGAQLVVTGAQLGTPAQRAGLEELGHEAARAAHGRGAVQVAVARDGRTARIDIPMPAGDDRAQRAAVERVRATVGDQAQMTGAAAGSADFTGRLRTTTPIVVGLVLAVAMVLLLAAFRSPALALGVMGLNLLSIGATYGLITAVFQHHWAEGLLGFTSNGSIVDWLPLFAFVIVFGLSMDYTILVLERVREARAAGRSARAAAAEGIGATGGVVTSAALVMVAVFLPYAALRLLSFKQFGLGLASAVLLDATIVRGIALPALIALVGERRWPVRWENPVHGELRTAGADA
jgi:RND superfamily putative drug exporter